MNPPPRPHDDDRDEEDRSDKADRERERRANRSWRERGADWLERQGVSTVLLCLMAGILTWFCYYIFTTGIPAHLNQIQTGYKELQAEYKAMQTELLTRMAEDRRRDREWASMEREKDRTEFTRTINLHLEKEARKAPAKGSEGT